MKKTRKDQVIPLSDRALVRQPDIDALLRTLPPELDGNAITAAIAVAFAELGLQPEADLPPGQTLRIFAVAAKSFLDDPSRLKEALHLTEQAGADRKDSAALAHIRIIALWRLGERAKLIVGTQAWLPSFGISATANSTRLD